jgi:hypothetical protein
MSSNDEAPEDMVDTSKAGGLGEIVPDSLMPVWMQVERVQAFRRTYGDTYVTALEALTAIALVVGYLWWAYLYLTAG